MATLAVGGTTVFDGATLQSGVSFSSGTTFPAGHIINHWQIVRSSGGAERQQTVDSKPVNEQRTANSMGTGNSEQQTGEPNSPCV